MISTTLKWSIRWPSNGKMPFEHIFFQRNSIIPYIIKKIKINLMELRYQVNSQTYVKDAGLVLYNQPLFFLLQDFYGFLLT